ncbi:unnamed protein product [Amoebophrya sp. A120]|nr:unnamed protein product [Amoebophrya sp. A120]|eukprot:GSA120T00011760001.1
MYAKFGNFASSIAQTGQRFSWQRCRYMAQQWRDRWSWYRFWQIRENFWEGCTYVIIGGCVLCSAFSLFEVLRLQRNNIQRMWIAYVRKERERSELMEIIKQARAAGLIPPTENEMQ